MSLVQHHLDIHLVSLQYRHLVSLVPHLQECLQYILLHYHLVSLVQDHLHYHQVNLQENHLVSLVPHLQECLQYDLLHYHLVSLL